MAWMLLVVAGLLEVAWAVSMKLSRGWSRPVPSVVTMVCMVVSFALLARAMRDLPAGTAYAVWTGIGAAGVAVVGMVALGEAVTAARVVCIALIVCGCVGLRGGGSPPGGTGAASVGE